MGLLFAALIAAGPAAAQKAALGNPVNDRLLAMPPAQQAKTLAKNVGHGCVGTSAFAMGVVDHGQMEISRLLEPAV